MNQTGKNVFLTLSVVVVLLVIVGLRRNFQNGSQPALLSQPAWESETASEAASGFARSAPRPRVLQAKPVTQYEQAVLSPTNSPYAGDESIASPATARPSTPLPTPVEIAAPGSLAPPPLVPADEVIMSPAAPNFGDQFPEEPADFEAPTVPVAASPVPEFVVTDAEDSFWSISERIYGSGVYYRALFRHNEAKVLRPDQLRAGIQVHTPPLQVLRELYPADFPQDPSFAP